LDAETNGVKWAEGARPVGWAVRAGGVSHYLPFGHRGGGNLSEETVKEWARRELRGKQIINHSTKFDMLMARAWGVDLEAQGCTFRDVAHSAALLDDHRKDFGLDALGRDYLGLGKLDAGPKKDLAELPAWDVSEYAKRDVDLVDQLYATLAPELSAQQLDVVQQLEDDVLPAVVEMEWNGMPLDVYLCDAWERESKRLLEKMRWEVAKRLGFSPNPDSPKDMVKVFHHFRIGVLFTANGTPSFTKDIMKAAAAQDDSGTIQLLYEIGKLVDLRSKYLEKYLREHVNGIIHGNLWQLMTDDGGTVSGRFSMSNPNLQQVMGIDKHLREYGFIPARLVQFLGYTWDQFKFKVIKGEKVPYAWYVKELFRNPDGALWLAADAKQIEYRIFGHYSESENIIGRYRADPETDFHNIVQAMILPVRPDINRTETKTANFLKIFGGGNGALARNLNIDDALAAEINAAYDEAFPEAKALLQRVMGVAESRGWVKTILGRRCRFPLVKVQGRGGNTWRERERTHKGLNGVVQGSAADVNKRIIVEVHRARKHLEVTPRVTVHDEWSGGLHNPAKESTVRDLLNTQYIPFKIPILWDVKTGRTWGDCK
jgi:DNA polymerase I-like protein with 3'-5' exonuclease and polymerase domains